MTWEVYTFNAPDGTPFYVGSGKQGRAEAHFRGQKATASLARRFAEIRETAGTPSVLVVGRYESVDAALRAEGELIASLLPSGTLANRHAKPRRGALKENPKGNPMNIQLDADERAALEKAAAHDKRPVAAMGRKAIAEWLSQRGWVNDQQRKVRATFDSEADAIGVYFETEGAQYDGSEEVAPGITLDFDVDGQVIGVELLGVRELLASDLSKRKKIEQP